MKRSPFSRDPWYVDALCELLPLLVVIPVLVILYLGFVVIHYLFSLS